MHHVIEKKWNKNFHTSRKKENYVKTHNPKVCNYSCLQLKRCSPFRLCLYILLLDGLPTHSHSLLMIQLLQFVFDS